MARMKRSDEKLVSNKLTSLFCCSQHFTSNDYKKSLTGIRHDLVRNAVPSIFPWTVDHNKGSERSERANVRDGKKTLNFSCWPIGNEASSRCSELHFREHP